MDEAERVRVEVLINDNIHRDQGAILIMGVVVNGVELPLPQGSAVSVGTQGAGETAAVCKIEFFVGDVEFLGWKDYHENRLSKAHPDHGHALPT